MLLFGMIIARLQSELESKERLRPDGKSATERYNCVAYWEDEPADENWTSPRELPFGFFPGIMLLIFLVRAPSIPIDKEMRWPFLALPVPGERLSDVSTDRVGDGRGLRASVPSLKVTVGPSKSVRWDHSRLCPPTQ